jgi:BirA family transcriptional regulator, biotin operon repressor / biotin---[acetyl-CoA-carboxylase] ligase
MANLKIPAILTDLAHVGPSGLPLIESPWFQRELETCREWGFQLATVGNRVILNFDDDQLVPYWIQREVPAIAWDWQRVLGFLSMESTNIEALAQARLGAPGGTLVFAEEQTAGKGRQGRSWFSPRKAGLYLTLIVRPQQSQKYWPLLSHVASVALVETLQNLFSQNRGVRTPHPDIKWPNDVLIAGKKCAGILLEALPAAGLSAAAVIGVGIDVREGSVPPDLAGEAICLDAIAQAVVPRRRLLVDYLRFFQMIYLSFEQGNHGEVLEKWKSHSSMWDDVEVRIEDGGGSRIARTCGLDDTGALRVRTENGSVETILAGNIYIRRTCADELP